MQQLGERMAATTGWHAATGWHAFEHAVAGCACSISWLACPIIASAAGLDEKLALHELGLPQCKPSELLPGCTFEHSR